MRILHTADWHLGKKLGRIDRRAEYEQVLDEVVTIARDEKVDLVIVAGDLLDRMIPPFDAIHLMLDSLVRLADVAGRVVVICGNHDSAELLAIFGPLLETRGITLVPRIVSPDRGGVIRVPSRDGSEEVRVAALPFLHEAQAVDFMDPSEEWFKSYADRIRLLCAALCKEFDPAGIGILAGHFFVHGAELGGGERQIHIGNQYAATAQALPPGAHYAALGHIHKPQAVKGSAIPARYSGSLLQLDFSERTHGKEVVVVEAVPGRAAKVRPIPLSSGRRLIRVEDTLDGLQARVDELSGAYLDVRVTTDGPTFGLADRVREFLPDAVMVQAVWERSDDQSAVAVGDRALADLYAEFHASARGHGTPAPPELLEAVRELEETVIRATS